MLGRLDKQLCCRLALHVAADKALSIILVNYFTFIESEVSRDKQLRPRMINETIGKTLLGRIARVLPVERHQQRTYRNRGWCSGERHLCSSAGGRNVMARDRTSSEGSSFISATYVCLPTWARLSQLAGLVGASTFPLVRALMLVLVWHVSQTQQFSQTGSFA